MRHGEVEHQITAPSGVLQVVEDLHVTAFLPILGAGRDTMLRPNPVTLLCGIAAPGRFAAAQVNFGTPCSRRWCAHARLARTGFPSSLPTRSCSFLVALRCWRDAIHTRRGRVRRLHI